MSNLDPLQLTDLLADPFYELRTPAGRHSNNDPVLTPGQLVNAHIVYPAGKAQVLKLVQHDPRKPESAVFKTVDYVAGAEPDKPLVELGLPADEKLYVLHGKPRPAIVLQTLSSDFSSRETPEQYALVAPCYTFKNRHTPTYRAHLAGMQYPHLFYVPAHADGFGESGAVRLELIQPVRVSSVHPLFKTGPRAKFLSATAWAIFQHRLYRYIFQKVFDETIEKLLTDYSGMVLEALSQSKQS